MFLVDSKAGELHAQIFDIGHENDETVNVSNGQVETQNWSSKRTEIKSIINQINQR